MATFWQKATDAIGLTNYQDVQQAKNNIKANRELAQETQDSNKELLDKMYNNNQSVFGKANDNYDAALTAFKETPTYTAKEYSYDKNADDFLSPARNMRVQQAMGAIENSRANAGGMFSSDTMNEMNAKAQLMASDEWDKAYDRLMNDRSTYLNEWKAEADEGREAYKSQLERSKDLLNLANTDRMGLYNANNDYYSNLINNNNAVMSTQAGINNNLVNADLQRQGIGGGLFKLGTGILTALS